MSPAANRPASSSSWRSVLSTRPGRRNGESAAVSNARGAKRRCSASAAARSTASSTVVGGSSAAVSVDRAVAVGLGVRGREQAAELRDRAPVALALGCELLQARVELVARGLGRRLRGELLLEALQPVVEVRRRRRGLAAARSRAAPPARRRARAAAAPPPARGRARPRPPARGRSPRRAAVAASSAWRRSSAPFTGVVVHRRARAGRAPRRAP